MLIVGQRSSASQTPVDIMNFFGDYGLQASYERDKAYHRQQEEAKRAATSAQKRSHDQDSRDNQAKRTKGDEGDSLRLRCGRRIIRGSHSSNVTHYMIHKDYTFIHITDLKILEECKEVLEDMIWDLIVDAVANNSPGLTTDDKRYFDEQIVEPILKEGETLLEEVQKSWENTRDKNVMSYLLGTDQQLTDESNLRQLAEWIQQLLQLFTRARVTARPPSHEA